MKKDHNGNTVKSWYLSKVDFFNRFFFFWSLQQKGWSIISWIISFWGKLLMTNDGLWKRSMKCSIQCFMIPSWSLIREDLSFELNGTKDEDWGPKTYVIKWYNTFSSLLFYAFWIFSKMRNLSWFFIFRIFRWIEDFFLPESRQ